MWHIYFTLFSWIYINTLPICKDNNSCKGTLQNKLDKSTYMASYSVLKKSKLIYLHTVQLSRVLCTLELNNIKKLK